MKQDQLVIPYKIAESESELSSEDQELLLTAKKAAQNAYAPYSHFKVGAAVRLQNGEIVIGNNQENAAYPSGLCAERTALFGANSRYPGVAIIELAVTAIGNKEIISEPVPPCGACRQVMTEYESLSGQPMRIIMQGGTGEVVIFDNAKSLLPFSFLGDFLKKYTNE